MAEQNPYQSPKSAVQDFHAEDAHKLTLKQIWFSFEGRISRKVFWLYSLLLIVPIVVIILVATAISPVLALVVSIPLYIAMLWASLALNVKRWHDRDRSGWFVLLGMIPLVNIWALIETGFLRGTQGPNRFGGDATDLY